MGSENKRTAKYSQIFLSFDVHETNQMHQCIKFILFWSNTLHVSDGLTVHHQEFKTLHTATSICETDTAVCLLVCLVLLQKFLELLL